jgi:hypothetical protein
MAKNLCVILMAISTLISCNKRAKTTGILRKPDFKIKKTAATVLGEVRGHHPRRSRNGKEGTEGYNFWANKAGKIDIAPLRALHVSSVSSVETQPRPLRELILSRRLKSLRANCPEALYTVPFADICIEELHYIC